MINKFKIFYKMILKFNYKIYYKMTIYYNHKKYNIYNNKINK